MNTIYKSKIESVETVEQFLKRGGSIEVIKPRKTPKQKMSGKTTRASIKSTSGFAAGFPRKFFV